MTHVCTRCGSLHDPENQALPGSGAIELVLWLFALVPGLIYSIWRRGGRPTCAGCGSRDLVASDSPVGRQLLKQYHPGASPAPRRPAPPAAPPRPLTHRLLRGFVWSVGLFAAAVVVAAVAQRV